MPCTDPDAIAEARRSCWPRLLDLCDPDHPDYAPGYLGLARRLVRNPPAPAAIDWPPCDHRESCACSRPRCWHGSLGPRFGVPVTEASAAGTAVTVRRVTPDACRECVQSRTEPETERP